MEVRTGRETAEYEQPRRIDSPADATFGPCSTSHHEGRGGERCQALSSSASRIPRAVLSTRLLQSNRPRHRRGKRWGKSWRLDLALHVERAVCGLFGSSPGWTRTNNPPVNSRMLCQLSYRGTVLGSRGIVAVARRALPRLRVLFPAAPEALSCARDRRSRSLGAGAARAGAGGAPFPLPRRLPPPLHVRRARRSGARGRSRPRLSSTRCCLSRRFSSLSK